MKNLTLAGTLLGIVLIGGAAFFLWHPSTPNDSSTSTPITNPNPPPQKLPIVTSVSNAPALLPPRTSPAGYSEYRSEFYRFQFFYPKGYAVAEHTSASSSITIAFQKTPTDGFQIFIIPYGEEKISEQRFKLDIPSGVMSGQTTAMVDSSTAALFYSKDAALGDTFNAWFVGRGFLYEVTAYKQLDNEIQQLLQSWQFL